tara:strand:- start:623 stop:874 length:252 start_codon:yes stop_codon:yes gene_type:complete
MIFAEGDEAQKLIIIALGDKTIATIYPVRALLPQLTAIAHTSDFFRESGVETYFTFCELAEMPDFKRPYHLRRHLFPPGVEIE